MKLIKRLFQYLVVATVSLLAVAFIAGLISPRVTWRLRLFEAKLFGKIPEISWPLLIRWSQPGSAVNLYHLAAVPNVSASVTNYMTDRESAAAGGRTFGRVCSSCHGDNARGRSAPDLISAIGNMSDWKFFSAVKWGRPKTMMMAQPLSESEIWQVCAFLRQSSLDAEVGKKFAQQETSPYRAVSTGMLLSGEKAGDWLTYSGNYAGYRHSSQSRISRNNIQRVRLAWASQLPSEDRSLESSPIVVADRLFVTESPEGVSALDARTGAILWEFHRPVPANIPLCCGAHNRGVAVLGKRVYVETLDAHLLALDADSGAKVWDVEVADWRVGYSMTAAPLAIDDRILVGVAGGDFGIRGFVAAYSASDGTQLWRSYTIPAAGEPGNETWGYDSWQHGGVATWNIGAYDPNLGLVYWGTGNPDPVFNSKIRPGNNLYANSILALDVRTGQLRWYYQFTPQDDHDWDSAQQPVLADIEWQGQAVPALFLANRNAFFYALNRSTGRFLFAKPFAKQTWASGFSPDGRAIPIPDAHPSPTGTVIWPAASGGTNWWAPSFDPKRHLMFVPSVDVADLFFNVDPPAFRDGKIYLAGGFERAHNQPITVAIRAIEVTTGELRWDSTLDAGGAEVSGEVGGVLSTDGGLVFGGYGYEFVAFDADTGERLWNTPLGGMIHAAPISYSLAGIQYIAVVGGRTLFVFDLPTRDQTVSERVLTAKHTSRSR